MASAGENSKPAMSKNHPAANRSISVLIASKDLCCISTISSNGWPHLVPVSYAYQDEMFYIPASRSSKKVRNLRRNPKATILIDEEESESGVLIECKAAILQNGEAKNLREFMRTERGWRNDETTVVLALRPLKRIFWSLRPT